MERNRDRTRQSVVRTCGAAFFVLVAASLAACSGASSDGAVATWTLAPNSRMTGSSTGFDALVTRLDCNSGVTGTVMAPEITYSDAEIVVTFEVLPKDPGSADCQGNDSVRYDVDLEESLDGRSLVDGACGSGNAETTAWCVEPTKWAP